MSSTDANDSLEKFEPKPSREKSNENLPDPVSQRLASRPIKRLVLLFTGSFNPVTIAHLRLLELARDYYHARSIQVLEGIVSPVGNSYGKPGLLPSNDRLEMLHACIPDGDWIRIDPWESEQPTWTRTRLVLDYHHELAKKKYGDETEIRLIAGADVLQSMLNVNVWTREDIHEIINTYGVVCINRLTMSDNASGVPTFSDPREGFEESWKKNIDLINDWVINDISATSIRKQLLMGISVKYIVPDGAIDVIYRHGLYGAKNTTRLSKWPWSDNSEPN